LGISLGVLRRQGANLPYFQGNGGFLRFPAGLVATHNENRIF